MINYWLSEVYLDEKENTYKPLGWDLIEGRGYGAVKHSFVYYKEKAGKKVILETDVSPAIEQELRDLGLKELGRVYHALKNKTKSIKDKIQTKDLDVLDFLE